MSDRHTKIPYNIAFNSSENNPTEENLKKLKKVVDKQSYIAYNQSSGTDRAKKNNFRRYESMSKKSICEALIENCEDVMRFYFSKYSKKEVEFAEYRKVIEKWYSGTSTTLSMLNLSQVITKKMYDYYNDCLTGLYFAY